MSRRASWAWAIALVAILAADGRAQRLPVRRYTTADGLGNARVFRGLRDARGFLWFATQDGLSRFDGSRFDTFGTADGLPGSACQDVVQTRDGWLWVATDRGVARLDPAARAARARFRAVAIGHGGGDDVALALFEDSAGTLWFGTQGGLWRTGADGAIEAVPLRPGRQPFVNRIVEDRAHSLWLGTTSGLFRRAADGRIDHAHLAPPSAHDDRTESLRVDRAGRLWVAGAPAGLVALVPPPPGTPLVADDDSLMVAGRRGGPAHDAAGEVRLPTRPGEIVSYLPEDGFPADWVRRGIYEDGEGALWFGTGGLIRFDGHHFAPVGPAQGLVADAYAPLCEDDAGNLWLGGNTTGAVRLARRGLVAFDQSAGLDSVHVMGLTEDAAGALYATTFREGHVLNRLDGEHFVAVRPQRPTGQVGIGAWGWGQIGFPDRDGRWWFATSDGATHYPKVARFEDLATTEPEFFGPRDGLPGRDVFRLYQDAKADVWISTMSGNGLARWDHTTDRVAPVIGPGLPAGDVPTAFAEDRAGGLWIGYDGGELVRLQDGATDAVRGFGPAEGLPGRSVQALLIDHLGRLWIATSGGVVRVDEPAAERPAMVRYTVATGLSTDQTTALAEDARGRIHVGTVRGIDRIDPGTGEVGHLTTADGLPDDYVNTAFRDHTGQLWFGTHGGLARLLPDDAPAIAPPLAVITSLRVAGVVRPLALDGERAPAAIAVDHDDGQLDLGFTSPSFAVGTPVQFQVRLDGADRDWTSLGQVRAVHYAHLAPGHYHFWVRAVFEGGLASAPAGLSITVRPPLWRRPWFVALTAVALALLGWWLDRRRVAHLIAVERVRTRIATDLHDDLGSSLSRIAILSEVAARRATGGGDVGEVVGDIGTSARALVDVASDIVWSTDPRRDDLGSLLVRLRSFAGDVLEGRGVAWRLDAPAEPERIKIGPDQRRHLYLIVKEAVANAARHAAARQVTILVSQRGRGLEAVVTDDGRGVDATRNGNGHGNGLANMRARAKAAGGTLTVDEPPGGGTRVTLRLP